MSSRRHTVDVLAIQFWVDDPVLIRRAVDAAGFIAHIKRVDIEPALHAVLGRQPWDLVIYDPATPDISIDTVRRLMKELRRRAPLVILDDASTFGERVQQALRINRS